MNGDQFPRAVTVWIIAFAWIAAVTLVVALRLT